MSVRRAGLPLTVKMRHNAHYVEEIISRTGAAIGRMIPLEEIQPNPSQPRKAIGDLQDELRKAGGDPGWAEAPNSNASGQSESVDDNVCDDTDSDQQSPPSGTTTPGSRQSDQTQAPAASQPQ